jgi:excinuclease ABC subunit A
MCTESGISYEEPSPNAFSFNSPFGACATCNGLGVTYEVNRNIIIPDEKISINKGGILPIGEARDNYIYKELAALAKRLKFSLNDPIAKLSDEALHHILYGEAAISGEPEEEEEVVIHDFDDRWYTLAKGGLVGFAEALLQIYFI